MLPGTVDRTQLKRRSLKNAGLTSYDLIPQNAELLRKAQVKTHLCQIIEVVLQNNKELFEFFKCHFETKTERNVYSLTTSINKKRDYGLALGE